MFVEFIGSFFLIILIKWMFEFGFATAAMIESFIGMLTCSEFNTRQRAIAIMASSLFGAATFVFYCGAKFLYTNCLVPLITSFMQWFL